jgi:hypothetical protein
MVSMMVMELVNCEVYQIVGVALRVTAPHAEREAGSMAPGTGKIPCREDKSGFLRTPLAAGDRSFIG